MVGTQAASTNAWTGNATFSELRDGQTILYWLPFAGTSSNATLNLTLGNGTTTGAVPVYINGTTRCTTHVAVGNITLMTYRVNTPIAGSGSYTGWWINRTNITNFGAFVDIGVHQDGLVHISQMANRRIAHPLDVVKLHQHVQVRVIEVDRRRNRISLSMKGI